MIKPIIAEDLFVLNDNLQPQFDGEVIIIDNIFKNFEEIVEVCYNMPVEQWKTSPTSRNFKDYYDCRPVFNNFYPNEAKINKRLNTLFSLIDYYYKSPNRITTSKGFNFNYFKSKLLNIPPNLQHTPHRDSAYNCVFYIDPYENGGTALYEEAHIDGWDGDNLFYDISNLKIKKIISSKPNRGVIFPGDILHGGYIENHNIYYNNWRINLVNFLDKEQTPPNHA
jgi:hypothetical protein